MIKIKLIVVLMLLSQLFIGQNEKPTGGCKRQIFNSINSTICNGYNGNQTFDLCILDSIRLSASLNCNLGAHNVKYQWMRNGIFLLNDTLPHYTIKDTGSYSCLFNYYSLSFYSYNVGYFKVYCSTIKPDTLNHHSPDTLITETKFYPNPTDGHFTIEPKSIDSQIVELIDVSGEIIFTQSIIGKTDFDFSAFDSGVYTLSINNNEKKIYKKIIIHK